MLERVECIKKGDADRFDDCRQVTMFLTESGEEYSRKEAWAQQRAIPGYLYIKVGEDKLLELQPAEKEDITYVRVLDEDSDEDPLLDVEECPPQTFLG